MFDGIESVEDLNELFRCFFSDNTDPTFLTLPTSWRLHIVTKP